jgi:hypothetical protein
VNNQATVFHITHPKAGSQWVANVLKQCAPRRFVPQKVGVAQFKKNPIKPGGIYSGVYVTRPHFEAIMSPGAGFDRKTYRRFLQHPFPFALNWFNFQIQGKPYLSFVVIRDLRDTLISLYFSLKTSHPLLTGRHAERRRILNTLDKDDGLVYLMVEVLKNQSVIQLSWLGEDALFVKYEELLADEHAVFERIIDYGQIDIDRKRLHEIVRDNSFETISGRKRGTEDETAHQRKGVAGDWRNHFSGRVKEEFKKRFGKTLIKTGYERDLNW